MLEQFPPGFLQALAHNPDAMEHFFRMPYGERKDLISSARGMQSKEDMENLINRL